jgi:hypothetical protein
VYIAKRACYMMYTVYISTGSVFQIMNALATDRGNIKRLILYIGCLYINGFVSATNNSFVFVTIIQASFIGLRAIISYVLAFQYLYSSIDILLDINDNVSS